ncbi:hypothetical protein AB1Y20_010709 [Prymnesium parvum]|uniref:tRNA-uridine aminocarboxypropyltransferase n=1 Tax=Prymnesium parvum TaxID=97485 RepID=A0AB34IS59_PRYPA
MRLFPPLCRPLLSPLRAMCSSPPRHEPPYPRPSHQPAQQPCASPSSSAPLPTAPLNSRSRLVVLIGTRAQLSHAAHVLDAILRGTTCAPPVDVPVLPHPSTADDQLPALEMLRPATAAWEPQSPRGAKRIRSLLARQGTFRHDLVVDGRLMGRILGPRGIWHMEIQQRTGCAIIIPAPEAECGAAARRDRTRLFELNRVLDEIPEAERSLHIARRTREHKLAGLCGRCWMMAGHCVCSAIRSLGPLHTRKVDVHIAVHYKEYGRATATAKLLPLLAPDAARLHPYPEVPTRRVRVWVRGATPAGALKQWVAEQQARVPLLVLDGTWANVKSMARQLGDVPGVTMIHVNDEVQGPSQFKSRRQISAEKVSTVEAIALALEALGEEDIYEPAIAALELSTQAEMTQGGVLPRKPDSTALQSSMPSESLVAKDGSFLHDLN